MCIASSCCSYVLRSLNFKFVAYVTGLDTLYFSVLHFNHPLIYYTISQPLSFENGLFSSKTGQGFINWAKMGLFRYIIQVLSN